MDFESKLSELRCYYILDNEKLATATAELIRENKAKLLSKISSVVCFDSFLIYLVIQANKSYKLEVTPKQIGNAFLFKNNGLELLLKSVPVDYEELGDVMKNLLQNFPNMSNLVYNCRTYLIGSATKDQLLILNTIFETCTHPNIDDLMAAIYLKLNNRDSLRQLKFCSNLEQFDFICKPTSPKYDFSEWELDFFKCCIIENYTVVDNIKYLLTHLAITGNVTFLSWLMEYSLHNLENNKEIAKSLKIYFHLYKIIVLKQFSAKYSACHCKINDNLYNEIFENDWFDLGQTNKLSLTQLYNKDNAAEIFDILEITKGAGFNVLEVYECTCRSRDIFFDEIVLKFLKYFNSTDYSIFSSKILGFDFNFECGNVTIPLTLKVIAEINNQNLTDDVYETCNRLVEVLMVYTEDAVNLENFKRKWLERCLAFSVEIILKFATTHTQTNKDFARIISFLKSVLKCNLKYVVCQILKSTLHYFRLIFVEHHTNIREMIEEECKSTNEEIYCSSRLRHSVEQTILLDSGLGSAPGPYCLVWTGVCITHLLKYLEPKKRTSNECIIALNKLFIIMNNHKWRQYTKIHMIDVLTQMMLLKRYFNESTFNSAFYRLFHILTDRIVGSGIRENALSRQEVILQYPKLADVEDFILTTLRDDDRREDSKMAFVLLLILFSKTHNDFSPQIGLDYLIELVNSFLLCFGENYYISVVIVSALVILVPLHLIKPIFFTNFHCPTVNSQRGYFMFLNGLISKFKYLTVLFSIDNGNLEVVTRQLNGFKKLMIIRCIVEKFNNCISKKK